MERAGSAADRTPQHAPRAARSGASEAKGRWEHGQFIRARREALQLSQLGLARAARVTSAMINRLESGQRRGRPPVLRAVAEALQVPEAELLERAGYLGEAGYWREHARLQESSELMDQVERALNRVPCRPAVRAALLTVLGELARDREREFRERFEQAAAGSSAPLAAGQSDLTRAERDTIRIAALRERLFTPASGPAGGAAGDA